MVAHAQAPQRGVVLYEGARLIAGDGGAPIESSAFLVEHGRFTRVGEKERLPLPSGAARVDLTGKTVIPALVDAHSHIGYMKNLTSGPQNYTRENILDHMHRFAYFGVAASQAMGSDFGELPFRAARRACWPGSTRMPPGFSRRVGASRRSRRSAPTNMRHAAYAVTTVEGARAAVEELARAKRDAHQDLGGRSRRNHQGDGSQPVRAIIDEAHKQTCASPSTRPDWRTRKICFAPASTCSRT